MRMPGSVEPTNKLIQALLEKEVSKYENDEEGYESEEILEKGSQESNDDIQTTETSPETPAKTPSETITKTAPVSPTKLQILASGKISRGPRGFTGPAGSRGHRGSIGPTGPNGVIGCMGMVGPTGPQGNEGLEGNVGNTGPTGTMGLPGPQGESGEGIETGPRGPTGLVGEIGPQGHTGPEGPVGPESCITGPQGLYGPSGPRGPSANMNVTGKSHNYTLRTCKESSHFIPLGRLLFNSACLDGIIFLAKVSYTDTKAEIRVINSDKKILGSVFVNSVESTLYTLEEFDDDVIKDEFAIFTVEAKIVSENGGALYPEIVIVNW